LLVQASANGNAAAPAKRGLLGSFVGKLALSVVGSSALSAADLAPALEDMKRRLMERNVAEEIAAQVVDSVAHSLEGQKLSSFTGARLAGWLAGWQRVVAALRRARNYSACCGSCLQADLRLVSGSAAVSAMYYYAATHLHAGSGVFVVAEFSAGCISLCYQQLFACNPCSSLLCVHSCRCGSVCAPRF
jgi:hypothetical protein